MSYAVALSEGSHRRLLKHLVRADGQEDLCFAVWNPSRGSNRTTAVVNEILLPLRGERRVHGNASFMPQYFERAIEHALKAKGGVAFLHSHPDGAGWQRMSCDDHRAEATHAGATVAATGLPLIGLTLATQDSAWSGRAWERTAPCQYEPRWCESVRVVGSRFALSVPPIPRRLQDELDRTVSAWGGQVQARIAAMRVGVVGLGSVGSLIAEALARMGVGSVVLIDFDRAERVNRDRVLHLYEEDVVSRRLKVEIAAEHARRSATASHFEAVPVPYSVNEPEGFRAALDCDVLFSCVDRPWPRFALNVIAYAHLILVVDGGIRLEQGRAGGVRRGDIRAHVIGPGRTCLECLEQFTPEDVALDRDGYLDDPSYLATLPEGHHLRDRQNVFSFSLMAAGLELMHLTSAFATAPGLEHGPQAYHFIPGSLDDIGTACRRRCPYRTIEGLGDRNPVTATGRHELAEQVRSQGS